MSVYGTCKEKTIRFSSHIENVSRKAIHSQDNNVLYGWSSYSFSHIWDFWQNKGQSTVL